MCLTVNQTGTRTREGHNAPALNYRILTLASETWTYKARFHKNCKILRTKGSSWAQKMFKPGACQLKAHRYAGSY